MESRDLCRADEEDRRALRDALGRYATGVTVVIAGGGGYRAAGITVNSFASVSLEPPLVLWSVERSSSAFQTFVEAPKFTVSVLASEQQDIALRFADANTHPNDRLTGAPLETAEGGLPLIARAAASFDCRLEATYPGGDHVIVLGRVGRVTRREGATLLFHDGAFGQSE